MRTVRPVKQRAKEKWHMGRAERRVCAQIPRRGIVTKTLKLSAIKKAYLESQGKLTQESNVITRAEAAGTTQGSLREKRKAYKA